MKRSIAGAAIGLIFALAVHSSAQSPQPYPNAAIDRNVHPKTAMLPPALNVPFTDPDFGSHMVRATNESTNFRFPGTYSITESSGQHNEWNVDSSKFFVLGQGGLTLALGFDPATMTVNSLLLVPLQSPTFSSVDPDLIYGTAGNYLLTIASYRFSTGQSAAIIDTTKCGTRPALVRGVGVYGDSVTASIDDTRFAIDEGGPAAGKEIFVVVYDKTLGCRWYNTQTGEIGGQWGPAGRSPFAGFLINHAYLSKSGTYVRILAYQAWYVWDLATLNVTVCRKAYCNGYGSVGYDSYVNAAGVLDGFQIVRRPLSNLQQFTELNSTLTPHNWGQELHFTWSNANISDIAPICASSYRPRTANTIAKPFEGEIFCIESDGRSSTIWRFAHNRATSEEDDDQAGDNYFNSQPLGNVSPDGRFFCSPPIGTASWGLRAMERLDQMCGL